MEHYNNLNPPWMLIAKTNKGEVFDSENSHPSEKKPFYQIYFSGLDPGGFFPLPCNYFIKKRNKEFVVEEKLFIHKQEEEVRSLDKAHKKILEFMEKVEDGFKKIVYENRGVNLNVYCWLGEPDIKKLGLVTMGW